MKRPVCFALALAVGLSWLGCNCGRSTCITGQSSACACPSGSGAQVCLADGTFGECVCGGAGGGSAGGSGSGGGGAAGGTGGGSTPPVPALGAVFDRAGRPFTSLFTAGLTTTTETASGQARDNQNAETLDAAATSDIAASLGLLDGVDNSCGNQTLFDATEGYQRLARGLGDDRLWLKLGVPTANCDGYLWLEMSLPDACGGRAPGVDSYDRVLGAFIAGQAVDLDHVASDGTVSQTFPFLAP